MSKIREMLIARVTKASTNGKGIQIGKGYSSTWNKVAKTLQEEGKFEFRGGRIFMVGVTPVAPKPVEKKVAKTKSAPKATPAVVTPKTKPTPAKRKFVDASLPKASDTPSSAPKA